MKINILLCDTFPGLLPDYIESYQSMFFNLFDKASSGIVDSIEYKVYYAMNNDLPDLSVSDNKENQIFLITGCNKASYDHDEWIVNLLEWIKKSYTLNLKMVGICFGHQAIALALGGKVERYSGGWGIGIRASKILDEKMNSFFKGEKLQLLYNHHDQVTIIPQMAKPLATSQFCKYEGLRVGENILTFQGHPEYIVEYEKHLLKNHSENEDPQVINNALYSLENGEHQSVEVAKFILSSLR